MYSYIQSTVLLVIKTKNILNTYFDISYNLKQRNHDFFDYCHHTNIFIISIYMQLFLTNTRWIRYYCSLALVSIMLSIAHNILLYPNAYVSVCVAQVLANNNEADRYRRSYPHLHHRRCDHNNPNRHMVARSVDSMMGGADNTGTDNNGGSSSNPSANDFGTSQNTETCNSGLGLSFFSDTVT